MRWLLLVVVMCLWSGSPANAALRLQLDTAGLTDEQIAVSRDLLEASIAHLPPSLVASGGDVTVAWTDALPHDATGRARRDLVLLNQRLLPALTRSARDEVLATVLHEVAHLHDRSVHLSSDPRLLDLAGWQVKAKRPRARSSRNSFVDRTPDPYELTSPREFVAVNLEYFLLDPEYACRRPALHRFFSEHFGWAPPHPDCPNGFSYLAAATDPASGASSALATLDPARVESVEYLLAEGNSEPMSRWGHSMLRLVVCAPGRLRGPDCRLDLQFHLVLSFRAFIDDVQLSSWRGLSGSYPSRLFVLPLEQVVEEYTRDQLRGLQSVPLAMDDAEIAMLLERAGRLHWSYDGRYYFVSNNCAFETFKLLHDGVPRLGRARLDAITPTGLLRKLDRRGIADIGVLDNVDEARRLGYRFDSMRERYQAMFDVARGELALPQTKVDEWLQLPASERRIRFDGAGVRATAALLVLEESARRHKLALARQELKRRYLSTRGDNGHGGFGEVDATLQEILQNSGFSSRPSALLAGQPGYGLPQAAEITVLQPAADVRAERLAELGGRLTVEVQALLDPSVRAELAAVVDNLDVLGRRMRRLNREADGIEMP